MLFNIKSDGTAIGTKVEDSKGKLVGKVQKVTWEADINSPLTKCTIEILGVPVDLNNTTVKDIKFIAAVEKPAHDGLFYIRKIYDIVTKKDDTPKTKEELEKEEAEFMALVEKVRAEVESESKKSTTTEE